jgi:hypothetical protein
LCGNGNGRLLIKRGGLWKKFLGNVVLKRHGWAGTKHPEDDHPLTIYNGFDVILNYATKSRAYIDLFFILNHFGLSRN